ncbi:MAG TPA: hypothetical protein EYO70_06960 [Candidatus Marinimicrobia bacterium]|nr:hypothetical protein [Candidatus Neomarinimicrobiota bacterium]
MKPWMIYGANGYSARIILKVVSERGMKPIIAGRNRDQIDQLSSEHGLDSRIFDLTSFDSVSEQISDIDILLNCAGPFSSTAEMMISACLHTSTHYIDITGEIDVFEYAHSKNREAKASSVVICPGVGFDVVPTDCLAVMLQRELPSGTDLSLAFQPVASKLSPGTAKTAVEGASKGGWIRKNGQLLSVPLAYATREIDFGSGPRNTVSISWGDVSTAYFSTGIPNIQVYLPMSEKGIERLRKRRKYAKIMKPAMVQNFLKRRIEKNIKGQSEKERKNSKMNIWGELMNPSGDSVVGRFDTGNGYDVTAVGAVEIVSFLNSNRVDGGYYTPAMLAGTSILEKLPGYTGIQFERFKEEEHE